MDSTGAPPMPLVVIVDDDADVRHLLNAVLTQSGFETVLTANATDGVEAVREFNPIVTLLDVSMPGMDGFAAARRIREFSGTYIMMLTALADEIDVIQGLGAGADDYLLKPVRPRELRARIETLLRRPRERWVDAQLQAPDHQAPVTKDLWTAGQVRTRGTAVSGAPTGTPAPQAPAPQAPAPQAPAPQAPAPQQQPVIAQPAYAQAPYQPAAAQQAAPTQQAPVPQQAPVQQQASYPAPPPAPTQPGQSRAPQPGAEEPDYVELPVQRSLNQPQRVDAWVNQSGLALNTATGEVTVDGRPVTLNPSEFALLATLIDSGRRVRSTANLVLTLRGESYVTTYYVNDGDKRAVKAHMTSLRRKIGDTGLTPRWIESVRGVGYRMTGD
ncbi:response regulator transcription factor [Nocardioides sp. zg-ZUI104]|uniref:winged helix-turn-helix transcriptional regulator n=1 Tax=Nocardioides faecalis TaxID=2803858 RepID=UPI001BCF7C33|nr:response regulator transcription factor [Nocardioides faecalis]MBS4751760.1 response regulator transcription factor [Nocardioides faecalis]